MDIREFIKLVQSGTQPVIQFGPSMAEFEEYAETGMRAKVLRIGEQQNHSVELVFDFGNFEAHNLPFEGIGWRDPATGHYDRTAREAGYYKAEQSIYFSYDHKLPHVFELLHDARVELFKRYQASGSTQTYTGWLEDELLKAQST